jgi:predicted enzyme related to lactoylglutathione lyase
MAGKGSFVWYELMTTDTKAAEAFYTSVVGWNAKAFEGGQDYTILNAGENGVGGIMATPEGMGPFWIGYIGVADTDAAAAGVEAAGGKIEKPAWDIPGVGRMAAVSDPQGAGFMLMTPSGEGGGPNPAMGTPGHIGWRELHTTDWEKAFGFYSGQFGWAKGEAMDMGPAGIYQILTDGGEQFGAMFNSKDLPRPVWLFYFNVASIDAAVEKVKAGGGQVINGPMEVPGGQWIINGVDPQGAMFALVGAR